MMSSTPPRLWRNGMDYEPKKTYPPDYSNVLDVRDWQMSPFSKERFDLDEIQRAEKRGVKGKAEVEKLKQLYLGGGGQEKPESPPCPVCAERESAEKERLRGTSKKDYCDSSYRYQPYGPAIVSTISYSRPESNKPKMYNILGPSHYSNLVSKKNELLLPTFPCQNLEVQAPGQNFKNFYIPYGPFGEIRFTPDMYVPMGPSVYLR